MKEKTENEIFSFSERVIKEVVKQDDEHTKQVIKDYFRKKYPKENLRFDFLDEEIVNKVVELGIAEYQKRQTLVDTPNKEKTADELFEELGYKKIKENVFEESQNGNVMELVLYRHKKDFTREIEFWDDKTVNKQDTDFDRAYITMQELQAINKKVEELGWK